MKENLEGECAMATVCKALLAAVHRETAQAATDKRVAIEGLVIKDLLKDLNCQWRWVSSERQLSDRLTQVGAWQAFVERYKGSYIQLVADEAFRAAKKKSKEERERTVSETRVSRVALAQTMVALLMNTEIQGADALKTLKIKNTTVKCSFFAWFYNTKISYSNGSTMQIAPAKPIEF